MSQAMKYARVLLRWGMRLIGPALLLYFLLTTDLQLVWQTLLEADFLLVLLALVLVAPFLVLKAVRWQLILRAWQIKIPLREATALYCIGVFLGAVTPGQAGDAVKAWYLRKHSTPLSVGLASVVVDRLFDVGITALLAATGIYFFWDILPGGRAVNILVVAGLLAAVVAGLAVVGSHRLCHLLLRQIMPRLMPRALRERASENVLATLHLSPRQIVIITLVTIAGLVWTYVRIYILFLAINTPIALGPFIALVAILAFVQTASPGGVGTRDATLVYVLGSLLALDGEQAVARALSLSALLLLLSLENVVIGFLVSLRYSLTEVPRDATTESSGSSLPSESL
jgi:uncharacterized protein (TIRG00374 family)